MQPSVCLLILLPLFASGGILFASDNLNQPERGRFCLSNDKNQTFAPIYDLDKIESRHLPDKPKGWISELATISGFNVNYEVLSSWDFYRWREMPQLLMKGDGSITNLPFDLHYTASEQKVFSFSLLAENATLIMTGSELNRAAPGYVLQFDFYNRTTKSKELKMLKCDDARVHDKNCISVFKKEGDLLDNGNSWTHFKFNLKYINSANIFTISKRNLSPISWKDTAPDANYNAIRFLAVSKAKRPGIIKLHAVPFLTTVPAQKPSTNFTFSKVFKITKDAMIGIDVFWKDENSDCVKLSTVDPKLQEINCENFRQHTKCKTQILKSGSHQVTVKIENPRNILLIENYFNHTYKSVRISEAEDGSWFKGCQTLPADGEWEKEEMIISSSNCNAIAIQDTDIICDTFEQQTPVLCQSLKFCTLPSKSINSNHSDILRKTVGDVSKALPSCATFPESNQTDDTHVIKNNTCKCWSDQLPFVKHLLWTMLCANLVMFVIVSLRWRPLLKQRQRAAQQEVSKRPRLPEPQQIASKYAAPLC